MDKYSYVKACSKCVEKDSKYEALHQEFNNWKEKYKDAIKRADAYTENDPEYADIFKQTPDDKKRERRKKNMPRGSVPWDEPYERRRYPPSGYD